jgi:hypothetical protein
MRLWSLPPRVAYPVPRDDPRPRPFLLRPQLLTPRRQLGWWLRQPLDAPSPSLNAFKRQRYGGVEDV